LLHWRVLDVKGRRLVQVIAILTLVCMVTLMIILYEDLKEFVDISLRLTDVEKEARILLGGYVQNIQLLFFAVFVLFFSVNIIFLVFCNRKFNESISAIRQHIHIFMQGDTSHRVFLKRSDPLGEISNDLNKLSEYFETKWQATEK